MREQGERDNLYSVYRSNEFVNRNKEIERIMKFLKERQRGVIILEGDRGSGKTALLLELFRRLNQMPEYRPFFVGLFSYSAPEFEANPNLWLDAHQKFHAGQILELLKKLAQYWQVEIRETDSVELQKEYLARELSLRSAAGVPLLLVDSIYECDESLRVELETNVLMPLLTLERVFILLSGRGKRPIWGRPELQNAEIIPIPPLHEEDVSDQLKKMNSPRPSAEYKVIADLSGGFPLTVRVIGSSPPEVPLSRSLNQAIDVLLDQALSEEAKSQYADIRHHVEKMSLLDIPFRIAEIEDYLFPGDPEKTGKTDKLIRLLLQSFILRYEGKGYRLNSSIVYPIRKWLEMSEQQSDLRKYVSALEQVSQQLQERYPKAATWYSRMLPSVRQTSQLN